MDLDDLLGDEAPVTASGAADVDPLGDVLGDAAPHADDVLGGPPPAAPECPYKEAKVPRPRRPPLRGGPPRRVHPVTLPTVKDPPPHAKPYLTNTAYYVNAISLVKEQGTFHKRGILVNDNSIYIMTEDVKVERTVPIYLMEAVVLQNVLVAKSLGMKTESVTHVLIHLREGQDLFFTTPAEKTASGTATGTGAATPSLTDVLVALMNSYDLDLPVCHLKDGEFIHQLVKWTVSDLALRRESTEVLAYRTMLSQQLQQAIRRDARMIVERNEIESSGGSAKAAALVKEIQAIETKNSESRSRLQQITATLNKARARQKELMDQVAAQEKERAVIVAERIKARQGEAVAKQLAEYEVMKASHQSDLQRLQMIHAVLAPMVERRRKVPTHTYHTSALVVERLKDLRQDWAALQDATKLTDTQMQVANEALAEARRRLVAAKASLASVTQEVADLEQIPEDVMLPEDFNRDLAETFLPVRLPDAHRDPMVAPAPATPARRAAPAAGTLALSDDDDDLDVKPAPVAKPAVTVAVKLSDDDDDDDLPPPPAPAQRIVLDDDL